MACSFVDSLQVFDQHQKIIGTIAVLVLVTVSMLYARLKKRVMMLDFTVFNPPEECKIHSDEIMKHAREANVFTEANLGFLEKIFDTSGISKLTAIPEGVLKMIRDSTNMTPEEIKAVKVPFAAKVLEAKTVMFKVVEDLLKKTGITPKEIGAVIVACDGFAPTPSLAAMIVNEFKLSESVLTYNLAGMGCANGGICVDLAKHLLNSHRNMVCLLISHENCSSGAYIGNEKSMLLPLCLFRYNGSACLISNRRKDMPRAKYDLVSSVRIHVGQNEDFHTCIQEMEDDRGILGVKLSKAVIPAAAKAITANLTALAPKVLPYSELVKAVLSKDYQPDFASAFEHFCLQNGGKGVIDALQKALQLSDELAQPSRDSLFRFGNTAGSSSWYTLSAIESHSGVAKGERVCALLLGGGFKSISLIWKARRRILDVHPCWDDSACLPGSHLASHSLTRVSKAQQKM